MGRPPSRHPRRTFTTVPSKPLDRSNIFSFPRPYLAHFTRASAPDICSLPLFGLCPTRSPSACSLSSSGVQNALRLPCVCTVFSAFTRVRFYLHKHPIRATDILASFVLHLHGTRRSCPASFSPRFFCIPPFRFSRLRVVAAAFASFPLQSRLICSCPRSARPNSYVVRSPHRLSSPFGGAARPLCVRFC